jgi:hypothetical protein
MIVVLMRSQHNALTSVTAGTMWAEVLANIVGTSGERDRQSLHVEAPAIAWATLRDHMMQRTFKTSGARAKVPSGWISSTKRLATSVAKMEAHPCWTGVGLPGTLAEVFPAWRVGDGWSPYPMLGAPFEILVPEHASRQGMRVTWWIPGNPRVERAVLVEHNHLAFGLYTPDRLVGQPDGSEAATSSP